MLLHTVIQLTFHFWANWSCCVVLVINPMIETRALVFENWLCLQHGATKLARCHGTFPQKLAQIWTQNCFHCLCNRSTKKVNDISSYQSVCHLMVVMVKKHRNMHWFYLLTIKWKLLTTHWMLLFLFDGRNILDGCTQREWRFYLHRTW